MGRYVSKSVNLFKSTAMKRTYFTIAFLFLLTVHRMSAQHVNFRALDNTKHLVSAHFGVDYGSYYGLSYGYVLKDKLVPLVIGTEFTFPFGHDVVDDWKWKTGVEAELWRSGPFSLTFKPSVVFRRYESTIARMYSIGTDISLGFGYVKSRWGAVAVASFDKAIVTHIKHGLLRDYYPEIRDGWYIPTGGNFKFGARLHYSVGSWNAFILAGKHFGQNFEDNPTMPFFAEVSVQKRLK